MKFHKLSLFGALFVAVATADGFASPVAPVSCHPLDPLSAEEIEAAVKLLPRSSLNAAALLYPSITLQEPAKGEVRAWRPGAPCVRRAAMVVYRRDRNQTFEAVANLTASRLESWNLRPGVQPNVMNREFVPLQQLVKSDGRWLLAMKRRGVDPDAVLVDFWAPGYLSESQHKSGARFFRAITYLLKDVKNKYANPVEGVVALVDASNGVVVDILDPEPAQLLTKAKPDYDLPVLAKAPSGLRPLRITQPEGVSFTINGQEVKWQGWSFRWSMLAREGPTLNQVAFRNRSVLYRAAISEMLVPYGDPSASWSFRNAMDAGEYGLGRLSGSLVRGADAAENAVYFDAVFADELGRPDRRRDAIAIYERDAGILAKHNDLSRRRSYSQRARELVLTTVATIGNYDYQLSWIFSQDGSLRAEVGLTGMMLVKRLPASVVHVAHDHYGHVVQPQVSAVHHQHVFNYRLDFDVDGLANRLLEQNSTAMPLGPDNPLGNAFVMTETAFLSELEARRDLDLSKARKWRVVSSLKRNDLGEATGYTLIPGVNSVPFLQPGSPILERAGFVRHHLWATQYSARELYAAGAFPNQSRGQDGLPVWQQNNQSLDGTDLVVWYTFGVTHTPRPEDWPVMPVSRAGFQLIPSGFFAANPIMDLPAIKNSSQP